MKWYYHTMITILLIFFTLLTYSQGLGYIPFLFAAIYLAITFLLELNHFKSQVDESN